MLTASVKKNKTRLGKIMSKTAKTLGNSLTAVSMLSQKKHSDHSERDSFSAPSTPGVASSFSGFRGSQSSSMAPIAPLSRTAPVVKSPEVTRARPESLPINRSASKVPVRAMSSRLTPQRPSQDFSGNEEHNSDVEEKPSPARYSSSDSAQLLSPTVVAHSFSARIPKGMWGVLLAFIVCTMF